MGKPKGTILNTKSFYYLRLLPSHCINEAGQNIRQETLQLDLQANNPAKFWQVAAVNWQQEIKEGAYYC